MNKPKTIDRLLVISLSIETLVLLREQLVQNHFYFTQIESSGGIIQKDSASLLVGIAKNREEELIRLIRKTCKRRKTFVPARVESSLMTVTPLMIEAEAGGALIYTLDVELFEQF
jgi:uncharacterized protein YaaQ